MAKKQTALAVADAPRETLYLIESELRELCEYRDSLDPATEAASIDACDKQIVAFIGREIRKVTSIAAMLRYFRGQAEAAKVEERHARKWHDIYDARYQRLATMVHSTMVAMDVQKLEGATDRFRRQNNPEALEVVDLVALPDEYLRTTIRLPKTVWDAIALAVKADELAQMSITSDVDAVKLKAALQSTVDCPKCMGMGVVASANGKDVADCEPCGHTGQVRATIPGAKLTRGEHLRVE